jgi:hypothetical protein
MFTNIQCFIFFISIGKIYSPNCQRPALIALATLGGVTQIDNILIAKASKAGFFQQTLPI